MEEVKDQEMEQTFDQVDEQDKPVKEDPPIRTGGGTGTEM